MARSTIFQDLPYLQEASPMNFLTSSTAPLSVRAASRAAWWSSESSRTTGTTRLLSCLKSKGPFHVQVKTNLKKLVTFSTGAWATSPTSPPPGSRLSLIILLLLSSANSGSSYCQSMPLPYVREFALWWLKKKKLKPQQKHCLMVVLRGHEAGAAVQ